MTPFIAELLGTALLVFLGDAVVANVVLKDTKGFGSGWIVITTGWAMAVYVGVLVSAPYSGAHLNPAVSVSLAIAGKFPWSLVPTYVAAQFLGAFIGAFFVWLTHKDHFDRTPDPVLQLAVFSTIPAIRNPILNFINEAGATFVLIIAALYITDAIILPPGNHMIASTHIGLGSVGALPIAFVVWGIGLSLGGTTGYAINPARDLAPRLMHSILPIPGKGSSQWSYAPIPLFGPLVGGALAAFLFRVL
jgi:glycerol uptake facilitator protein